MEIQDRHRGCRLHKELDFVWEINSRSFEFVGHLVRLEDRSIVKMLLLANPSGILYQQMDPHWVKILFGSHCLNQVQFSLYFVL